jgi:hypothetical protein
VETRRKPLILGIVGLLTFVAIWYYMNHITYKSDAAANKVNVLIVYSKSQKNGQSKANIILKPVKPNQKISAFKVVLTGDQDVQFVDAGPPLATEQNVAFSKLEQTVTQTKARVAYVIPVADESLPSVVTLPVVYIGRGRITFNASQSQVAGNIPQNVYTFGKVESDN